MNRISCFLFAICCLNSFGQTNSTTDIKRSHRDDATEETLEKSQNSSVTNLPMDSRSIDVSQLKHYFIVPCPKLRPPTEEPEDSLDFDMMATNQVSFLKRPLSEPELADNSDNPSYAFSYRRSDLFPGRIDPELYKRLEAYGCLTPHSPPPDNAFTRAMRIFEPEVVHIGQFDVACSIITAIKRKNPLCLLNPMVLNVAW